MYAICCSESSYLCMLSVVQDLPHLCMSSAVQNLPHLCMLSVVQNLPHLCMLSVVQILPHLCMLSVVWNQPHFYNINKVFSRLTCFCFYCLFYYKQKASPLIIIAIIIRFSLCPLLTIFVFLRLFDRFINMSSFNVLS